MRPVSSGLIQNKMDLISALQFLKLGEIPQGKAVHFFCNIHDVFCYILWRGGNKVGFVSDCFAVTFCPVCPGVMLTERIRQSRPVWHSCRLCTVCDWRAHTHRSTAVLLSVCEPAAAHSTWTQPSCNVTTTKRDNVKLTLKKRHKGSFL